MNRKKKDQELWQFILFNLPCASDINYDCLYSDEEYNLAEKHLKPILKHLKRVQLDLVTKTFACLIRSVNNNKAGLANWQEEEFKEHGKANKEYHKMIPEFVRVMHCSTVESDLNPENNDNVFAIKEVIFKGIRTKDKITLSGPILELVKELFQLIYWVRSKEEKQNLNNLSPNLYHAFIDYLTAYQILNNIGTPNAKNLIKTFENTSKDKALNNYKFQIAFKIHAFLKNNSTKSSAKIPSWHSTFIGQLFYDLDLAYYIDYTDTKTIRNWIEWGKP